MTDSVFSTGKFTFAVDNWGPNEITNPSTPCIQIINVACWGGVPPTRSDDSSVRFKVLDWHLVANPLLAHRVGVDFKQPRRLRELAHSNNECLQHPATLVWGVFDTLGERDDTKPAGPGAVPFPPCDT